MNKKQWRVFHWRIIALAIAVWLTLLVRPTMAHITGTPHLINAPAGEYLLTVWTAPDPPRVNDFHVIVGVTRPDDPSLVLGERVTVTAVPVNGRHPAVTAPATHEQSDNKFLYEAYLDVADDGLYEVTVMVGEAAAVGPPFTVAVAAAQFNWQGWLFWGGLLSLAGWLTWRNLPTKLGTADRRRATARRPVKESSPAVGGQPSNL